MAQKWPLPGDRGGRGFTGCGCAVRGGGRGFTGGGRAGRQGWSRFQSRLGGGRTPHRRAEPRPRRARLGACKRTETGSRERAGCGRGRHRRPVSHTVAGCPRHRRPDTTKHAEPNAPVGAKAARSGRVWSPGHTGPACSTTVRRRNASAHLWQACAYTHSLGPSPPPASRCPPRPSHPCPRPATAARRGAGPRDHRTCATMEA